MKQALWPQLIELVKQHVKPALGCTEPVSVALASAIARHHLSMTPDHIDVKLSPNLYKNCMGVIVPGTGVAGANIAAAVGALGGNHEGGLEVLKDLLPQTVEHAKALVAADKVSVSIANDCHKALYVEVTLTANGQTALVIIEDGHINVTTIKRNDKTIFALAEKAAIESCDLIKSQGISFKDIFEFSLHVPFDDIAFILQAKTLNNRLSEEGLQNVYAMQIGKNLQAQQQTGLLDSGLLSNIIIRSSAASDARMGGAVFPAMSNSGSGNQGIAATMPVVVVAEKFAANDDEKLARALILSHLSAIYIHLKLPALSAFCAVSTASMGAATAIAWLITGKYDVAEKAITNMIGDISGVFCDGASSSCALKVSTASATAYKAVLLAMNNSVATESDGIVSQDIESTINNLCYIASQGMQHTDQLIIQTMYEKHKSKQQPV
ncbi:cysteine desulfidase [Orbus sasakiae]|uniref:UPF0597 protein GCM10023211_18980 n=1 Tax=Orbus sasakiae TaxID=1078475 RepID=A0ABP9N999_9GAMM